MKFTAIIQGQRIEIELDREHGEVLQARIGDRTYKLDAKSVEPGVYWFNWNNQSLELAVSENGEGYVVSVMNHRIGVEIVDSRAARRRTGAHRQDGIVEIRAPMPGKIVKVLLTEGSTVEANQGVVVMEAMKMQNEIKSPKKGIVQKVAVGEGAPVNAGDLIASVE